MQFRLTRRLPLAAALLLGSWALYPSGTAAAPNAGALLAQAERNTNSVKSLVYTVDRIEQTNQLRIELRIKGQEDEVRNREQDHEDFYASGREASGQAVSLHYWVDVIFVNGKTYYRRSVDGGKWHSQAGLVFQDRFAGFKRGRTTVKISTRLPFSVIGTSGGETHLRVKQRQGKSSATDDVYLSSGGTPYVVREHVTAVAVQGSTTVRSAQQTDYGPFNQLLVIAPPNGGST